MSTERLTYHTSLADWLADEFGVSSAEAKELASEINQVMAQPEGGQLTMTREPVTKQQVEALKQAFGLGATIVDWDIDYSLGRGVRGETSHCLWTKDGRRIDIEVGRTKILSQTKEPDPDRPTEEVSQVVDFEATEHTVEDHQKLVERFGIEQEVG